MHGGPKRTKMAEGKVPSRLGVEPRALSRGKELDAQVPLGESHSSAVSPQLPRDLHDRIGQMVFVGFRGLTAQEAEPTLKQIGAGSIGAVVLYDFDAQTGESRNIQSPRQLSELVTAVKAAGSIPPLITIDAEGGQFQELQPRHGFAHTATAREVGLRNERAYTRFNAEVIAEMLAEAGIDMNLAPVVDLLNPANPIATRAGRCYSSDPEVVTSAARELILTHRACGVLTAIKHFPGMRGIAQAHLPGVGPSVEDWARDELEPFRALISEGLADAVLTTRDRYPLLDPDYPACLSKKIVAGLLRSELGHDGVVISDPMERRESWNGFGPAKGAVMAVNAGTDLVLACNLSSDVPYSDDRADEVIRALTDAVASGEVEESRINEACGRILTLKARLPHA